MDHFRQISHQQAAYARAIDSGELESWPDFFVEDCVYRVTTADNHKAGLEGALIYCFSRGMLVDRVTALRLANIYEGQSYRHILGQPAILDETADEVQSETPFMVARIMRDGTTDLFATGRYLDRYKVDGAAPKLAERVVVCDSSRVDTLLALPL